MDLSQADPKQIRLPWSNTWQLLPPLPGFTVDGVKYNMTDTKIVSSNTLSGAYDLYLVGGVHNDQNTHVATSTRVVWVLEYNGSHHYWYQACDLYPYMGNK